MFYLDFDEERLTHNAEAGGDPVLNAKQLAGMMINDDAVAQMVAGALPWYNHLKNDTNTSFAKAAVEQAIDEFDVYLEKVGGDY